MENKEGCACCSAPKLIFPCSGASDVGEITDRTARQLTKRGKGKMYCLAGIGGGVEDIVANAKSASTILVIDGCPKDCAKLTMEKGGFKNFTFLRLSDMGMEKGKTPPTHENIARAAEKAAGMLAR